MILSDLVERASCSKGRQFVAVIIVIGWMGSPTSCGVTESRNDDTGIADTTMSDAEVEADHIELEDAPHDVDAAHAEVPKGCEEVAASTPTVIADEVTLVPGADFTTERRTIARIVDADIYAEISWVGYRPSQTNEAPRNVRLRLALRVRMAAIQDRVASLQDTRSVELFGIEHNTDGPLSWARLYPEDPPPSGCVRVEREGPQLRISLSLRGTLTALQIGDEVRSPVAIEIEDHFEAIAEDRSGYLGTCDGHPAATYLPLQVEDYEAEFSGWSGVEEDCRRTPGTGCRVTAAGVCGDGDRWLCRFCYRDTCLQPDFQSECLPE